ncbi:SGNH/GDSL hydrolase family protein [Phytomonospora endophytica]|uniref:Lysophospholipase L1-like esterase n=1 Tax=Phytomonospora endophytica TaxID=714109 RepID=A0A841FSI9_9ACTN|nr:SGNH/GDSL hydrolase family protein [Phytomonospora endophytica]MBB6036502.1 lysophospholipase L1-like esterase [Phytomonospora endophytica]GIG65824.1 hypothetical protein Pen01_21190 [Phytomonospora endophytica]
MRLSTLLRRAGYSAAIGAGVAVVTGTAVMAIELYAARRARLEHAAHGPHMRMWLGDADATPLKLVMLGDGLSAGVGVEDAGDTVGGVLAELLAGVRHWVALSSVAVPGADTADLHTQVARALLSEPPDVAVILLNGLAETMHPSESVAQLAGAVRKLSAAGTSVVVGTCPDLSSLRALAQPLRAIAGWRGSRLARAQAPAVRLAGGVPVDLASRCGVVFRTDRGMLCPDGLHPSAEGYRTLAHALYPAVYDAASRART